MEFGRELGLETLRESANRIHKNGGGALRVSSARALDTQSDPLHLILTVELHFLEFYFFEKVFRTEVGRAEDSLQFRFVVLVLFEQTPVVSVRIEEYVPRVPLQCCHAFLLLH